MQQWYQCPRCGAPVAFGSRFCTNCGTQLNWPTQQIQPPPVYQQQPQKKTSSSLIGCLGLIIGIVLLVVGGIFVINSGLQGTPASKPEKPELGCENLPEYVKQYKKVQPPVLTASGKRVQLNNNPGAKAVSFAELKSFIRKDDTSERLYILGVRDCVDFAEQIHNNAERAGIKAAFVGVNFAGEKIGHALNAFCTTDRGLVYIDCTGKRLEFKSLSISKEVLALMGIEGGSKEILLPPDEPKPGERDKVAYIEKGKQYGTINIDKAESLQYSFYDKYASNWQKFKDRVREYINEVDAFNRALGGRTTLAEPEYSKFKAWQAKLREEQRKIYELKDKLGDWPFEPLGIVETVKIYW